MRAVYWVVHGFSDCACWQQFEAYETFQQNAPNVLKEIKNVYLTTFNGMMGGFWFISLVLMIDLLSESNWDWAVASLSVWEKVCNPRARALALSLHVSNSSR